MSRSESTDLNKAAAKNFKEAEKLRESGSHDRAEEIAAVAKRQHDRAQELEKKGK